MNNFNDLASKYYAKSDPLETIEEHTSLCLYGLNQLLSIFGDALSDDEKKLMQLAVFYHDAGKVNPDFQMIIRKSAGLSFEKVEEPKNIPHGYISPAFINPHDIKKFSTKQKKCLILSIIKHHIRTYDFDNSEVKEYIENKLGCYLGEKLNTGLYRYVAGPVNDEIWIEFCKIKGILNRVDYWASARSKNQIEILPKETIGKLINQFFKKNSLHKNQMQAFLECHSNENTLIIASTGSGKTEGALLWVNKSKAFYTLPLRTSINAMFSRIKDKYSYPEVQLLHSNAVNHLLESEKYDYDDAMNAYRISKSLSAPLTICTVDQILSFCYKYEGCEILLSTLSYSKLIIDEIQSYSPDLIAKIIYALKLIKIAGGKFLIMTATFPPVLEYFLEKEGIYKKELGKNYYSYITKNARHKIRILDKDFNYEEIKEKSKKNKILVICNTIKKAQEVYENLKNANPRILHSRITGEDRINQEKEILKFSETEEYGIWVTTQVVEASLDIDFDILYTEMCTADSLLQRLGRCFRKRVYNKKDPNVYINNTENGVGTVYDELIYKRSLNELRKYNEKFFLENNKISYINRVYSADDPEMLRSKYYKEIERQLNRLKTYEYGDWNKDDAKNNFRDIRNINVIPKRIYDEMINDGSWDFLMDKIRGKDKKERLLAEYEIAKKTISINMFGSHVKASIIKKIELIDTYIVNFEYDFSDGIGVGLKYTEEDEDVFL